MAEEFKVKVGVEVDTSKLDELENRIKNINAKPINLKVDVDSGDINKAVSNATKSVQSAGKNLKIKPVVDTSAFKYVNSILTTVNKNGEYTIRVNGIESVKEGGVEIDKLRTEVRKFDAEGKELDFRVTVKDEDVIQAESDAKSLRNELKQIDNIKMQIDTGGITNQVSKVKSDFNKITNATEETKKAVSDLIAAQSLLNEARTNGNNSGLIGSMDLYNVALDTAKNLVADNARTERDAAAAAKESAQEYANAAKTASNYASQRQKLIETYKAEKQSKVDVDSKYNKLNDPTDVSVAYKKYNDAKDKLFDTKNYTDDIAVVNEYNTALETVQNQLSIVADKEKNATAAAKATASAQKEAAAAEKLRANANNLSLKMDAWLKSNSAAASDFGGQIRALQSELQSCDAVRFSGIQSEFKNIQLQAEAAGKAGLSLGDKIKNQFSKLTSYFSAASVILAGVQTVKQMVQSVLEVDTQMTELKRVTDLTTDQYAGIYDRLIKSAQEYGTQLTDLISATADWSRAGFDADTAAGLAEITSVYQHIADLDYDTSSENLLTAYKGFQDQLSEQYGNDETAAVTHIADVYNEIDNNYATTAADIGEAIKRSASALSLAGNSLEETAGMVTGITEVTQDPEKAGNSLKVLSMRIRGMKGDLQDLGEEVDDNVENISQMQGKVLNLTHGKVNIFEDDGGFKSTYEIMQGIADVYDDLTDTDKADLLETIAGKNRANEVAALIQNWDRVEQATESAKNSAGSAMAEQEKYASSLQGRLDSLTASFQAISNTVVDSGFLKGIVSGATGVINIINTLIEKFGLIPTVMTAATVGFGVFNKGFITTSQAANGAINNISLFGKSILSVERNLDGSVKSASAFGQEIKKIASDGKMHFGDIKESFKQAISGIKDVFNGNLFEKIKSGTLVSSDASFIAGLDKDIDGIKRFVNEMQNMDGVIRTADIGAKIQEMMGDCSVAAQKFVSDYDKSWTDAGGIAEEFATKQQEAYRNLQNIWTSNGKSLHDVMGTLSQYNSTAGSSAIAQKGFAASIVESNPALATYIASVEAGNASLGGYVISLVKAEAETLAVKASIIAANAAISMGISLLVSAAMSAITSWINRAQELSDKVADITTNYKQQRDELNSSKKTIDDVADSYEKLSKGVNTLTNENVSLSTDEYSEYIDIVNQIADTFPTLVSGYDAQGNAVLTCAGNVEKLNEAYKELAENNYNETLKDADDVFEDFKNKSDGISKYASESYDALEKVINENNGKDITEKLDEYVNSNENIASTISNILMKKGYSKKYSAAYTATGGSAGYNKEESSQDFINRVISENPKIAKEIVSDFEKQMDSATSGMQTIAEAYIGKALIGGDYSKISDSMKTVVSNIVPNLGYDYFSQFKDNAEGMYQSLDDMLSKLNSLNEGDQDTLKTYFDLQTRVNNGDCTVGEYVNNINKVKSIIDNLDVDDKTKQALKLSLQLDDNEIIQNYEDLRDKISSALQSNQKGLGEEDAKKYAQDFVNGLSATELKAAVNLEADGKLDLSKIDISNVSEELKAQIQKESEYLEAMNFTIDIDAETDGLDKLNSALAESKSAAGLTADSIDAIKSRYQGLEGYNPASLFEETANGIRLNTQEYTKLERAYAQGKLDETTGKLETLKSKYDELTGQIATCTDAEERANLVSQQENIRQKINDLGELAAQYEGLTSKYNAWQNAESAGSDRDMYENVLKGFEEVDDELSRGWLDDASKAFIDMFSYDQLNSIDDYTQRWKTLGDTIDGTTYSVKDFFTQNKDGESTNDGVYNFLNAVDQLGQGNIKRDENGNVISFDFGVNGEDAIAQAMGISKELVQIIERAAEDAGFVINMDGQYTQFADLQKAAVESNNKIKELAKSSEELKNLGLEDYTFRFDSTDANVLLEDLNKSKDVLDAFRNEDGTINLDMEGAQDALNIASTLQVALDRLSDPVYMQLDSSQVDDGMKEPLQLLQEYRTDMKTLNQLKLQGADTSELDKSMDEIVDKVMALDDETKIKMGIDVNASREDVEKGLKSGEYTIDATVDLQVEMSKDLQDIRLLMMHQAGLLSDNELKLSLALDTTDIDKYTEEQQTAMVKFLPENTDFLNELGLDDGQKKIVVDFVTENSNILESLGLDDGQKKVLLDFVAKNPDFLKDLNDDEKKVIIDFVAKNPGFFDGFEGEDKTVAINFVAKNQDVLSELDSEEDKKVVVDYFVKNPDALEKFNKFSDEDKKIYIESIVSGQEGINTLQQSLDGLSDEQIQVIAQTIGNIDVEQLKTSIGQLDDKTVQAIATALGQGDVQGLQNAINGIPDQKVAQAIAEALGFESVEQLNGAIGSLDGKTVQAIAQALGIDSVQGLRDMVNGLDGKTVQAVAEAIGSGDVSSLQSAIDNLNGKTVNVVANLVGSGAKFLTGGGGVDGTAHVNGTAFANGTTGRAFKQGDWGTKEDGVALGGELGAELLVRNGRWYTIGEDGAEFFGYKKDDIIK